MPGILSTILYCGMNRETIQAFLNETGDERLVLDSYRRFIEHYSTTVLGIDIPVFETIRSGFLNAIGLPEVESLHAGHLESLAQRYQREIARRGHAIPEDVYEQLRQSVQAIYASWSGDRAKQFRKATKTSSSWGTAVMLMQMVYGNAEGSGASVFFTRNPFTGEPGVYGETRERATGDELVYGRRLNRPLSSRQAAERDGADGKERERLRTSLEETDHELFSLHRELAEKIEQAMDGLPQEAEVTYVRHRDGKRVIFVLQTRRMEFSYHAAAKFDEVCAMENRIIGRGIGAHGGAVSGVASFARHPEQAVSLSRQKGMPVILLRKTANTEDVSLMPAIAGIVTASGGVTSHAAVLAQKFDINAVVACSGLLLSRNEQGEPYARINGTIIQEGSPISIDGSMGLVFSGSCFNILK
jgi:pyruvate,orthophosphate dikinase